MNGEPITGSAAVDRLGDFKLRGVLGTGGSGTVYHARWGHRTVALKVLREALLESASERGRFLEEARLLYEINHPAVVKLLGFGELPDGRPYLAMERLEGESLAQRLSRGPLPLDLSLSLLDQLVSAVAALHAQGLIHRDIKPENIYLVGDGQYAVLLDFGIAKSADAPMSTVTREGGVRGTPAYMAPERFFGQPADQRSDIYELALVFYTMVTGCLPWKDSADPESRLNPARPSELGTPLPGETETVLLSALSTRAEARPATVKDFGECIAQAAAKAGATARRCTADMPIPKEALVSPTGPTVVMDADSNSAAHAQTKLASNAKSKPRVTAELGNKVTGPQEPLPPTARKVTGPQPSTETPRRRMTREESLGPITEDIKSHSRQWRMALLGLGGLVVVGALIALVAYFYPKGNSGSEADGKNSKAGGMWARKCFDDGNAGASGQGGADKEKKGAGGSEGATTGKADRSGATTAKGADGAAGAHVVAPKRILELFPIDDTMVAWLSYTKLRKSPFYKAVIKEMKIPKLQLMLSLVENVCSVDLDKQLQWVAVGLSGAASPERVDLLLRGTWNRTTVETCIRSTGQLTDAKVSLTRQGKLTKARFNDTEVWLAWPDDNTFLFSTRKNTSPKWFRQRLAFKNSVWSHPRAKGLAGRLSSRRALWLLGHSSPWLVTKFFDKKKGPRPKGLTLGLILPKDIILDVGFRFKDAASAKEAVANVKESFAEIEKKMGMGSLFAKLEANQSQETLLVKVSLDEKISGVLAKAIKESVQEVEQQQASQKKGKKK